MARQNKSMSFGKGMPNGKAKDFKKAIKNLIPVSKKYFWLILIAILCAITSSVLAVIGPNKLKELTNLISDNIQTGIDMNVAINIMCVLIAIYATSCICSALQHLMMTKVSQSVSKQLRTDIDKKINNVPLKYIDSTSHGDLLSRITNDADTIAQGLNNSVATLVYSITLLLASTIMMFVTNYILAFTTIGCSLLGFVLIAIIMKKSQKYFVAQQNGLGEINGHIEETYSGHSIVKVYNATDEKRQQFVALNNNLYTSAWKSQFLGGLMMPLMQFIGNFSYVAICVVGAVLVVDGKCDIGTIVAFIMYARLFTNPLTQIAQAFNYLQSTAAASERVFEFLETPELEDESHKTLMLDPKTVKGNVDFENICFGYTPEKTIISNFSINIKSGQKVAIVGPTGAGKTTMVNLLMRFYEVDSGKISIDGIDTKDLTRENIHNLFGMVLQDTWLFEGTVRQNLVFNKTDVDDKQLDLVCKECGLEHFINTLPQKYDTVLDDNTAVSIGQKQLLTIARAMIQNSPMIILDEATSNIDTRTEITIQNAMDKLSKNRTSFVIAHRLSTIKNADIIIVMQNGSIVETGKHAELLAKNGAYAKLYNSQFEN
ncbi:MAG TPA: ABC transporter [Clostridiales bacterium]|nr:ABC transporter [Clostridiales bacterium]